jgi:hypothetical protein
MGLLLGGALSTDALLLSSRTFKGVEPLTLSIILGLLGGKQILHTTKILGGISVFPGNKRSQRQFNWGQP